MSWPNRIKERTTVKASALLDHEGNWRIHPEAQKAGMVGVLNEVGIIDALTAYQSEQGLTIIDGHLRKSIDPDQEWPIDILDVSPEEADYILATKDPLAAAASADREKLGALLQSVQTGEAGVQKLLGDLARKEFLFEAGEGINPWDEWEGMPEFENEDNFGAVASIKVHFATEEAIKEFSELIGQAVNVKTDYVWFPKQERENLLAYKAHDES